jgi:hypothetical protein
MAWQKQTNYKKGKKDEPDARSTPATDEAYTRKFLEDWEGCRDRHPGQIEVLKAVFDDKCQYTFYRAGRKGAKTTTGIDVAWKLANTIPNSVGYLCYPTIAQGIEVVWEERRLQTCDQKDDSMFEKYVEKVDDSRHIVRFANGSFVKLIGTWTEARGRGTQPDFLIFDEFQDCNPDYIEAMDANLAAKPNAQCIIMGTPPKKRNHYEDWWERVQSNPRGKVFKFTSYDNIKLPHLREWLDNKKIELIRANKEDVWLREYMAETCYSSADRVLPDPIFLPNDQFIGKMTELQYQTRSPILSIINHPPNFIALYSIYIRNWGILVMDYKSIPEVWKKSYSEMFPLLGDKMHSLTELCGAKPRHLVWDESKSFSDVVPSFLQCRTDLKWQDRGIPLLREMMVNGKISFHENLAPLGIECQNLLMEEQIKEVQKLYPMICNLAMLVNEYFALEREQKPRLKAFDQFEAFRDMGIPYTPKRGRRSLFS